MLLTCAEESLLTTRDDNGVRFVGFSGGRVAVRDNEDLLAPEPGQRLLQASRMQNVRVGAR
jgi:hypothetical protein